MASGLRMDKKGNVRLLEKDVVRQVVDMLRAHGWRIFSTGYGEIHRGGRVVAVVGEEHMPDRLCIRYKPGGYSEVIWLEFKRPAAPGYPGGELHPDQAKWIELERARGALCFVPDDLKEFQVWYRQNIGRH